MFFQFSLVLRMYGITSKSLLQYERGVMISITVFVHITIRTEMDNVIVNSSFY